MHRYGRMAAALTARALVVGACTSDPDEEAASGDTTGLTDDTLRIGFIGADFAALAEAGLAPDLGDQPKVEVRITLVDGTAGPEAAGTAPGPADRAGQAGPRPRHRRLPRARPRRRAFRQRVVDRHARHRRAGLPARRDDPLVVASYLGTDDVAIARSDAPASPHTPEMTSR